MKQNQREALDGVRDFLRKNLADTPVPVNDYGELFASFSAMLLGGVKIQEDDSGEKMLSPTMENIGPIVERATNDPIAWKACMDFSARQIERGELLPPELAALVSAYLKGGLEKPKSPKGPSVYKNQGRNYYLALAVHKLLEAGFHLSQNSERGNQEATSACSEVAGIATELGYPMNPKAVERVWRSYN